MQTISNTYKSPLCLIVGLITLHLASQLLFICGSKGTVGFVRVACIGVQIDGIAQESGIHTKSVKV